MNIFVKIPYVLLTDVMPILNLASKALIGETSVNETSSDLLELMKEGAVGSNSEVWIQANAMLFIIAL